MITESRYCFRFIRQHGEIQALLKYCESAQELIDFCSGYFTALLNFSIMEGYGTPFGKDERKILRHLSKDTAGIVTFYLWGSNDLPFAEIQGYKYFIVREVCKK